MNSISLMQLANYQQRMNKITNNQSSPAPAPIPTQPMGYDTVSFKANPVKTIKPEVAKKGLKSALVAVAAFLGIKATKATATEATATEAKPLTRSEQLARDLRRKTHIEICGRDDYKVAVQSFNETAINGIVKVQEKRGAEAAYELAQILDKCASAKAEDTQYVIDVFNKEPELIEKYGIVGVNKTTGKKSYYLVESIAERIKSAKINPELTDLVLARVETANTEGFSYLCSSHFSDKIYNFIKETQGLKSEVVSKYVQDQRIPLDFSTILLLAKEDKEHAAEIEEYINFLSKNFKKKELSHEKVGTLFPEYIKAPEEVKAISTFLESTEVRTIAPLVEAYKANPELTRSVCEKIAKDRHVRLAGVNSEKAAELTLSLHQHADTIKSLTGMNWQDMTIEEISKIISKINENSDVIDRIIADGRGKDYAKLVELYRRYPDKEITPAMIERFHDPLAKFFDLEEK